MMIYISESNILTPFVYWAQTESQITLKVDLIDVKNLTVDMDEKKLRVAARGQGAGGLNNYGFNLDLHSSVNAEPRSMSDKSKKVPLKRHFISLESKMKILDRLKKGEKVSYVARSLNLNEATIRTIQKNEQKIRTSVTVGSSISANMTARPRAPIIEKMENVLSIWIDDSTKKRIALDAKMIKQKALKIYNYLRENGESSVNPDFVASKGWFERFKKRFSLQNMRIQGESASPDHEAAKKYSEELQKIIQQRGYTPSQVFNADEIDLWWKKMPDRIFIAEKKETADFKTSKERITLLLCSNASGDYIVKPMLVHRSLNPRAMKNVNKDTLPVYWTADKKGWVTADLFKQWFLNCFVPHVKVYLKEKNLDFKVLLLLDSAPGHSKDLTHPNVEVMFLPLNTTSLIQPLDQGIVSTFKTYYIKKLLQWVLEKINCDSIEVMEAWKLFSILDCIEIISTSLKELKPSTLNACWKNIWPESVRLGNVIESAEDSIGEIVELAKSVGGEGFDDMSTENIQEILIKEEVDDLEMDMPLETVFEENQMNSENYSTDENSGVQDFTLKAIQEGINLAKQLESYFLNVDPSIERSTTFQRELHKCLTPYYEIYEDFLKRNEETRTTDFSKKSEKRYLDAAEESSENEDINHPTKYSRSIVHT